MSDTGLASGCASTTAVAETYSRIGIINPYGGVWTWETFANEDEARAHLKRFWGENEAKVEGFTFERVHVRVARCPDNPKGTESK